MSVHLSRQISCSYYALVRMRRRHTVVGLYMYVILYICNSVFSEVAIN